jgi:hypothetical protein
VNLGITEVTIPSPSTTLYDGCSGLRDHIEVLLYILSFVEYPGITVLAIGWHAVPLERARLHKRPKHPLPQALLLVMLSSDFRIGLSPTRLVEC